MMTRIGISMMAALFGLLSQPAMAHCGKCGCEKAKICKPVHTTKMVKKVVWDCKVVEICLKAGLHPHKCTRACGQVRKVRKLIRREITEEVPACKWVIKDAPACTCKPSCGSAAPAGGLPPAPPPAKISKRSTDQQKMLRVLTPAK